MSRQTRKTMFNDQQIDAYDFNDVYNEEYESLECPVCNSLSDMRSLRSVVSADMFGGAHISEVVKCVVCDYVFETHQHMDSAAWDASIPF